MDTAMHDMGSLGCTAAAATTTTTVFILMYNYTLLP